MLCRLGLAVMTLFVGAGSATANPYVFTTVNDPIAAVGGGDTVITGINDTGALAGFYRDTGSSGTFHSFVDIGGNFTTIDDPLALAAGGSTFAYGINNAGVIAGYFTTNGASHGFIDIGGTFTTIDDPSAIPGTTTVYGINNLSSLVGTYIASPNQNLGFVDVAGTFTPVNDPAGTSGTTVNGINDSGILTGVYSDSTGVHGFTDSGGVFTTIVDPAAVGFDTGPDGINDAGAFVGQYLDNSNQSNFGGSFLDIGGVFTPINDPLADLSVGGTVAFDINNTGTIVGEYFESTGPGQGFVATPQSLTAVPEPNSFLLLIGGLAGLGAARRWRRRSKC
jgi:hypothetical protein